MDKVGSLQLFKELDSSSSKRNTPQTAGWVMAGSRLQNQEGTGTRTGTRTGVGKFKC